MNEWRIFVFDVLFAFVLLFLSFILSVISRVLRALLACLIYFWKISTEFRAMIFSMSFMLCKMTVMTVNCFIQCVLFDEKNSWNRVACEIFCDYHFLNARFMICFLTIFYEIHIILAHINFRWNEMIIYRMIYHEMLVCNFLIHVRIFKFCRDVCQMIYISQFLICLHARKIIHSYASIRTRCFDNWFIFRFRLIVALHIKVYLTKCLDKRFIFRSFRRVFRLLCTCSKSVEMF